MPAEPLGLFRGGGFGLGWGEIVILSGIGACGLAAMALVAVAVMVIVHFVRKFW
jgi:hypothetical protein